jgi:hypothetical protein
MALPSGRQHSRIRLAIPVKLSDSREAQAAENAVTENVSPQGTRVLVKTPKEPATLLFLHSPTHPFRASARVVYCQPLPGGQFGVGLELQGPAVNWANTQNRSYTDILINFDRGIRSKG